MSNTELQSTSFWSMLPQIASGAIGQYNQAQDRKHAEDDRQRQQLLQQLGILQTAAGQGADVNPQISSIMSQLGMSGVTPQQTPAQLRQQIMSTPDLQTPDVQANVVDPSTGQKINAPDSANLPSQKISGLDRFSDSQRNVAGLQTRGQVAADQAAISGAQNTIQLNAIKAKVASGQKLTPAEEYSLNAAGIKTPGQTSLANSSDALDFVSKQAPGYIQEWALKHGGRIITSGPKANVEQMIDQAYGGFVDRFGDKIPPEMNSDARAAFAKAAYSALQDQNELDLKRQQLALQQRVAGLKANNTRLTPEENGKLADQINKTADGMQEHLNNIAKNDNGLMMQFYTKGVKPGDKMLGNNADLYNDFYNTSKRLEAARKAAVGVSRNMTDDPFITSQLDIAAGLDGAPPPADAVAPPANGPAVRGKSRTGKWIVSKQDAERLKKNGWWDSAVYEEQ